MIGFMLGFMVVVMVVLNRVCCSNDVVHSFPCIHACPLHHNLVLVNCASSLLLG